MARPLSSEAYTKLGHQRYKEKEYESAVSAYTNAIQLSAKPSLEVLEARAVSYYKLGRLSHAIEDGAAMIRHHREKGKGYVRLAEFLEKKRKPQDALSVLERGLSKVSRGDKDYAAIEAARTRIDRALNPPPAMDPFSVLPLELSLIVLSYLTFKDRVNLLRVTKGLKRFITARPELWTYLDLSGAKRSVPPRAVRNYISWSRHRITRATLHRFTDTNVLRSLSTTCRVLTELQFLSGTLMPDSIQEVVQCAGRLQKLVYHPQVPLNVVGRIFKFRPTLVHVEFHHVIGNIPDWTVPMPNLKFLQLTAENLSMLGFSRLLSFTPAIENLVLRNWHDVTLLAPEHRDLRALKFKKLQLIKCPLVRFPALSDALEELELQPSHDFPMDPPGLLNNPFRTAALYTCVPRLTHLSMNDFSEISATWLETLLTKCPMYKDLALNDASAVPYDDTVAMRQPLTFLSLRNIRLTDGTTVASLLSLPRIATANLRVLNLEGCYNLTDEDLQQLPTLCSGITDLDISKTKVTGVGVKAVVDGLHHLVRLKMNDCLKASADVAEYARYVGIHVQFQIGMGGFKMPSRFM